MHENTLEPITTASCPPPDGHTLLRSGDELLVVGLRGDIDLATATRLRLWLDAVVAMRAPAYVVDLSRVSFIDSTGLNLVLRLRRRALETDHGFALLCAPHTRRLLRAHGTLDLLSPVTTLPEAMSELTRTRRSPVPRPRRTGRP